MMMRVLALVAALSVAAIGGRARGETAPPVKSSAPAGEGVVNLNDATEQQLTLLPGVGPAKARGIVAYRHGRPFRRAEDLIKVKGIGRKTFGRLRPYVTTVGPTTLTRSMKRTR
jgi:competence protein ComEA